MREIDDEKRADKNRVLLCVCGHSLPDHRGRVCGNIQCMEDRCTCEDFEFKEAIFKDAPTRQQLLKALANVDWMQVRMSGGPPCFFIEEDRFCLRAKRWEGHGSFHKYASLDYLIKTVKEVI